MRHKRSSTTEPPALSLEATEELIRKRAFHYYEQRGRENGHDLEDWFKAEAEIAGKKTSEPGTAPEQVVKSAAAA